MAKTKENNIKKQNLPDAISETHKSNLLNALVMETSKQNVEQREHSAITWKRLALAFSIISILVVVTGGIYLFLNQSTSFVNQQSADEGVESEPVQNQSEMRSEEELKEISTNPEELTFKDVEISANSDVLAPFSIEIPEEWNSDISNGIYKFTMPYSDTGLIIDRSISQSQLCNDEIDREESEIVFTNDYLDYESYKLVQTNEDRYLLCTREEGIYFYPGRFGSIEVTSPDNAKEVIDRILGSITDLSQLSIITHTLDNEVGEPVRVSVEIPEDASYTTGLNLIGIKTGGLELNIRSDYEDEKVSYGGEIEYLEDANIDGLFRYIYEGEGTNYLTYAYSNDPSPRDASCELYGTPLPDLEPPCGNRYVHDNGYLNIKCVAQSPESCDEIVESLKVI